MRFHAGLLALLCCCANGAGQSANMHVQLSAALINAAAHKDVNRSDPVNEIIQGMDVRGTAFTTATSHVDLIPCQDRAVFDVLARGQIFTRLYIDTFAFGVHTDSISMFEVRKRLAVDITGITGWPATSRVGTRSLLRGFSSEFPDPIPRALRETAEQQFDEDLHVNDTLASYRIHRELGPRFDRESTPELTKAGKQFRSGFELLKDYGVELEHLHFSTSRSSLSVSARFASDALPALAPPPELPAQADVFVRVHESAINHYLHKKLAGKELAEKDFKAALNAIFQAVGAKLDLKPAPLAVSVRFAAKEPITVAFKDDLLILTIHIEKFSLPGSDGITGGKVRARFRFEKLAEGGIAVVRQGKAELLSSSGNAFQDELIRTGFEQFMIDRIEVGRMNVPVGNIGGLIPTEAVANNGWLIGAWRKVN